MSEWAALVQTKGGRPRRVRFVAHGWRRALALAFRHGPVIALENLGGLRG